MNFIWGSAASVEAEREQNRLDRACVNCRTCAFEIPLADIKDLPKEFSLRCSNCGQRAVYGSAVIHAPKADAAATPAPRRVQFGKKAPH